MLDRWRKRTQTLPPRFRVRVYRHPCHIRSRTRLLCTLFLLRFEVVLFEHLLNKAVKLFLLAGCPILARSLREGGIQIDRSSGIRGLVFRDSAPQTLSRRLFPTRRKSATNGAPGILRINCHRTSGIMDGGYEPFGMTIYGWLVTSSHSYFKSFVLQVIRTSSHSYFKSLVLQVISTSASWGRRGRPKRGFRQPGCGPF